MFGGTFFWIHGSLKLRGIFANRRPFRLRIPERFLGEPSEGRDRCNWPSVLAIASRETAMEVG